MRHFSLLPHFAEATTLKIESTASATGSELQQMVRPCTLRALNPPHADIGLYGEDAPRSGPLVLEKGLEERSLDDVLLWLDAVYKQVGPATLEGTP